MPVQILKKIALPIFAFLVIVFSGGLTHYAHFCKDERVAAQFILPVDPCSKSTTSTTESSCGRSDVDDSSCDVVKRSSCCDDETTHFHVDTYSKTTAQQVSIVAVVAVLPQDASVITAPVALISSQLTRPPPLKQKASGKKIRILYDSHLC